MRLYKEAANKLVGKKVDRKRQMFGHYPIEIVKINGELYAKDANGGVEEIKLDEEYYLFQVYDGLLSEKVIEKCAFCTPEGYRIDFEVLDGPEIVRHTRIIIRKICRTYEYSMNIR